MAQQVFATKGNLINAKHSLKQAQLGYELMDRKRNILIREMVTLTDKARELSGSLEGIYAEAYAALQNANILEGVLLEKCKSMPIDNTVSISYRSVMGIELPALSGGAACGDREQRLQIVRGYQKIAEARKRIEEYSYPHLP